MTFTPRLLLVDLSGSLKHLPEDGALYSTNPQSSSENALSSIQKDIFWEEDGIEVVHSDPNTEKPEFQRDLDDPEVNMEEKEYNLSENVSTWTDFLYSRYHPRSINVIRDYKHADERDSLDTFSNGKLLWNTEPFQDEFSDRIRQYVEECDFLQGFQNIFDISNGFSGLSLSCMEYLNEEYSKSILAVPVFTPKSVTYENADEAMSNAIRIVNIALTYNSLTEHSSMFLPLSLNGREWKTPGESRKFPQLTYKSDNLYETSSILATYLDTLTLKYRFKNAASHLPGFCSDLTNYGRKLTAGALALPFQMQSEEDLIDCLDKFEGDLFTQISPNTQIGTDYVVQSAFVRGIPKNRLKKPMQSANLQMRMAAYRCDNVSEMFQLYFQCKNHASLAHVAAMPTAMATKLPFPHEMFDSKMNLDGFLADFDRKTNEKVISVPTLATVQNSGDIANTLETLHREAERIKIKKIHRFRETGFEEDEYEEMLENLLNFKDNYEDNFEL